MTSLRVAAFLVGLFCVIGSHVAQADIYRFKDENGVWHFSNINSDTRYKLFIKTYAKKPEKYIQGRDIADPDMTQVQGISTAD